jgi:hypothetical protein
MLDNQFAYVRECLSERTASRASSRAHITRMNDRSTCNHNQDVRCDACGACADADVPACACQPHGDDDRGTHAPRSTMLPCHVSDLRFRAALRAGATATSTQELADVEDEDDEQVPERAIASAVRKLNQRLQTSMQTTLGKQAQRGLIARLQNATSLSAVGGHGAAGASQSVDQLPETWPDTSEPSVKRRK